MKSAVAEIDGLKTKVGALSLDLDNEKAKGKAANAKARADIEAEKAAKAKTTAKPNTRESLIKETKKLSPQQQSKAGIRANPGGGYDDVKTGKQATNKKLAQATKVDLPKAKVQAGGGRGNINPPRGNISKPSAVKQVAKQSQMIVKMLAKTRALKAITRGIPIVGALLGPVFAAIESAEVLQDPKKSDEQKRQAITNIISGLLVGTVAAVFGAIAGAILLSPIPFVGSLIGGAIGGAVAYIGGDMAGRALGPTIADYLFDGKPVDKNGILAALSDFMESDEGKEIKANEKAKKGSVAPGSKPMSGNTVAPMSGAMDGAKPVPGGGGVPGAGAYATAGTAGAAGAGATALRNRDLPGSARQKRGLGISGSSNQSKPAMSATVSPDALEGSTPSVSASGPAEQGQRIAAAATTQKAAMVNQAARQQASGAGNNITINKAGDTQINQDGGGSGGSAQVVVVKSSGDMPKIGAKIAYGMGLA